MVVSSPTADLYIGRGMLLPTNGSVLMQECSWRWRKKKDMPFMRTYWTSGSASNVQPHKTGVCRRKQAVGSNGSRNCNKPSVYIPLHWQEYRNMEPWTEWKNRPDYLFRPNGGWQPHTHWPERWNRLKNLCIMWKQRWTPTLPWIRFTVLPIVMKLWFWKHSSWWTGNGMLCNKRKSFLRICHKRIGSVHNLPLLLWWQWDVWQKSYQAHWILYGHGTINSNRL